LSSFGERLRREREMRGISLDEIVAATKIGRRLLLALEDEQFDLLPGGIFNKSYVRAYAKCVGIDEEEAVSEYLQAAHEVPPDARVIAQQHTSIHSSRPALRAGFPFMPVLILLVVIAGGVGGWKVYQDRRYERQKRLPTGVPAELTSQASNPAIPASESTQSVKSAAPLTPAAMPTPAAHQSSASRAEQGAPAQPTSRPAPVASAPTDTPFEVTVRPKDAAWVSIKSDGKYVVRGIIRPPDVKIVHASSQVVFFTGNAGAVEVAFNGKNVPLAGGPNEEQVLVFDSRGLLPNTKAKAAAQ